VQVEFDKSDCLESNNRVLDNKNHCVCDTLKGFSPNKDEENANTKCNPPPLKEQLKFTSDSCHADDQSHRRLENGSCVCQRDYKPQNKDQENSDSPCVEMTAAEKAAQGPIVPSSATNTIKVTKEQSPGTNKEQTPVEATSGTTAEITILNTDKDKKWDKEVCKPNTSFHRKLDEKTNHCICEIGFKAKKGEENSYAACESGASTLALSVGALGSMIALFALIL